MSETDRRRRNQRLTLAEKDPYLALRRGWLQDPGFCAGFLGRCEQQALVDAPGALELAHRAVQFAEMHGDRHLVHRSYGVLSHAFLGRCDWFWAGKTLRDVRRSALDCCRRCRSEHLQREGDLLGELRKPAEALAALRGAVAEGGDLLGTGARGRIAFLRSIAHYWNGDRSLALADAGRGLRDLDLESPRGLFDDAVACLAIYVGGGGRRHDRAGLAILRAFRRRLRGRRGWHAARIRLAWVEGQLLARLGDFGHAQRRLERAHAWLTLHGLARERTAVTFDLIQLRCRHGELRAGTARSCLRSLRRCRERPATSAELDRLLREAEIVLTRYPECARREIRALRAAFVAPVPGLLGAG